MTNASKSRVSCVLCLGLVGCWMAAQLFQERALQAGPNDNLNGVPLNALNERLIVLEDNLAESNALLQQFQAKAEFQQGEFQGFGDVNLYGQTNVVDDLHNLASFNSYSAIIGILSCPPEEGRQSLAVVGSANFINDENGSFLQVNECTAESPVVQIGWNGNPNTPPGERPAVVLHDAENTAYLSPNGIEFENGPSNMKSCLNSVELLVFCGHPNFTPAGFWGNPVTGHAQIDVDHVESEFIGTDELSANNGFINEISTFNLIEISGTDNPY